MRITYLALGFIAILFLSGCTPDISAGNYSTAQAGQASRTVSGVIIAATPVRVSGSPGRASGIGTLAGAIAGAAAGSAIGGGARANVIGGVGGAVFGGVAGDYAENRLTQQVGMQYQVKLKNGSILTIAQGLNPQLNVGQRVYVILGNPARVIPAVYY